MRTPLGIFGSARATSGPVINTVPGRLLHLEATDLSGADGSVITNWPNRANGQAPLWTNPAGAFPKLYSGAPSGAKSVVWTSDATRTPLDYGPVMFTGHDVAWIGADTNYNPESYPVSSLLSNTGTWLANSQSTSIYVKLLTSKVVTGYTLWSPGAGRAPKNWTFQGSPDGSSWTVLDTRTNAAPAPAGTLYSFSNSTAYRFYRLAVTATINGEVYITIYAIRFTGANLDCNTPVTSACMYAVLWSNTNNACPWQFNPGVSYFLNRGAGTVYEHWGTNGAGISAQTPVVNCTQTWRVVRIATTGSAWEMRIAGSVQASLTGSRPITFHRMSHIGGSFAGYPVFTDSHISAILVLDHVPDSTEDALIRSHYLSTYGVS